jgi:catechol 2,3-dioxygenase-like lactoylglutathione lyase family enzyme
MLDAVMPTPIHETLLKFHASLNVADLQRSIAFYRAFLDVEPAKVRDDYAKFELAEPPLVLSLIPGRPGGNINHVGLRVRTTEELVEVQRRLETAGIVTKREEGVECCYARQTKFWVADPDRLLWEVYVFHEDTNERGDATVPVSLLGTLGSPQATSKEILSWSHRLRDPFPGEIPYPANTLHEVMLEGSLNAHRATPNRNKIIIEALRALRPGGEVHFHGLVGDSPCNAKKLDLPGPASAVEYVPTVDEIVMELTTAGFAEIHIGLLSEKAYFEVSGVPMRECRLRAKKTGHRPKQTTHYAVYRGPLAEVKDDYGNVFRRGVLTPLNVHDWQMLSNGEAGAAFILLAPNGSGKAER